MSRRVLDKTTEYGWMTSDIDLREFYFVIVMTVAFLSRSFLLQKL